MKARDPRTVAEWRDAAAWSAVLLQVDAARQYGLVTGGPKIKADRCEELLAAAKLRGIEPTEAEKNAVLCALLAAGAAR